MSLPSRLSRVETLRRIEVPADQLRVGDMREIGNDHISRVFALDPYWTGPERTGLGTPLRIDHRYIVVNGVIPPVAKDALVAVWR